MRRLLAPCLAASLIATLLASGEIGIDEELARLRRLLGLPASASVTLAPAPSLPRGASLKVHVVTGLDLRVRSNYFRWIDEWNRKEGKSQGTLEVVPDASEAEVILVRYTEREKAKLTSQSFTTPDPAAQPAGRGSGRSVRHSYSFYEAPVYAYVLRVPSAGAVEIVWRYAGRTNVGETGTSGRDLWDDFRKLLKARGGPSPR